MVENAVTRTMHHGGDVLNPAEKAPGNPVFRPEMRPHKKNSFCFHKNRSCFSQ
jgi:hypothetical protein